MRKKRNAQMNIFSVHPGSKIAVELEAMSKILDENPGIVDVVYENMSRFRKMDAGRKGMTAEQILRCAVLKQYRELSYEELAYHLEDSYSFREFSRMDFSQYPGKSVLQDNIKSLNEEVWEAINRILLSYAEREKLETGKKIRIDSTAVETNIHYPTDSTLLEDGVRFITRWLHRGKELSPKPLYEFSDHTRVIKKRVMTILNTRKDKTRTEAYRDILHYASLVRDYGISAVRELDKHPDFFSSTGIIAELDRAIRILDKVMDQTRRRVFKKETVPASEKIFSFFEDHTDIIVKGQRDTQYGHKVYLSGGASGMILDCTIEKGNPADSELYTQMLARHSEIYGRMPRQVSADGGFASKDNLSYAKGLNIKDAVFAKKRGLSIIDMAKSLWVYKKLRNFRAGIESCISALKRAFGLDRCTWTGWSGFKRYVWSSVFSYNLLVLARLRTA